MKEEKKLSLVHPKFDIWTLSNRVWSVESIVYIK